MKSAPLFDLTDVPKQSAEPTHESAYWLPNWRGLSEAECRQMAAGVVPDWLAEVCRQMVEWQIEDKRTWSPEERRGKSA